MVVDIGGGTTDIAVLSMNGAAVSSSLRRWREMPSMSAIARYVRRQHATVIGQVTAEEVKIQKSVRFIPETSRFTMNIKGRDAKTGMPKMVTLSSHEIYDVLRRPARMIADEVMEVLEQTSPGTGQRCGGKRHHSYRRLQPAVGLCGTADGAYRHSLYPGRDLIRIPAPPTVAARAWPGSII